MRFLTIFIMLSLLACTATKPVKLEAENEVMAYDLEEKIDQIYVDNLENIYILTADDEIVRYNENLEKSFEFNNSLAGDIVSIDATNPHKILCFIRDFNKVIVLDNTLAELNTIEFNSGDLIDLSALGRSNDDNFWLFEINKQKLTKVNDLGQELTSSNRMSDYNLPTIRPIIIRENSNFVFVLDATEGMLIFDNFGQYLKTIKSIKATDFQVIGSKIIFVNDKMLMSYDLKLLELEELEKFYSTSCKDVKHSRNHKYYIYNKGLLKSKILK